MKPNLPPEGLEGCTQFYELVDVKKPTADFRYIMNVKYGPPNPEIGCEIEWFIGFKNKFSDVKFEDQVQYDIFVVDDNFSIPPIRSIAGEEGKQFLFAPSGFVHTTTIVKENPGTAHYVIYIYGTSPQHVVPSPDELDFLQIDIQISGEPALKIPEWIKNNAGWWAEGLIGDSDFVSGIQYLIKEGIMTIPGTQSGNGGTQEIPDWIKNNAGWWAEGLISDKDFVSGIQWLIENGIMKVS